MQQPFAASMATGFAADNVALGQKKALKRSFNDGAFSFHRSLAEHADEIEVDIDGEPFRIKEKMVECRAAFEGQPFR